MIENQKIDIRWVVEMTNRVRGGGYYVTHQLYAFLIDNFVILGYLS